MSGYAGPASMALPPGLIVSFLPVRSMIQKAMKSTARIPMKTQVSIQDQSVPVKSTPASSCASTPAVITARNGRAPDGAATPDPWRMSVKALKADWCGRYAPERDDVTAQALDAARHRALRRTVRGSHPRHEVLGDARHDGHHRAARSDLAGRRSARYEHVPTRDVRRGDAADRNGVVREGVAV